VRLLLAIGVAGFTLMQGMVVAFANCPPNGVSGSTGYWYSGITPLSGDWGGIETDISADGLGVPSGLSYSHVLMYIDACAEGCLGVPYNGNCPNEVYTSGIYPNDCQIQIGYGLGHLTNNSQTIPDLYIEWNDVYKYSTAWYSNVQHPLSQNDFYQEFENGQQCDGGFGYEWNAYYSQNPTGSGATLIGSACLPAADTPQVGVFAELEQSNTSNYNCPTIAANQYFATNGSGTPTFNRVFNGTSWQNIGNLINDTWPPAFPSGYNAGWEADYWAWYIWGSAP